MQLTRQSRIAIAILAACGGAADGYLHTDSAAAGTGASKDHAAKVAHLLLRSGFLKSARGRHGGIRLSRPAQMISLGAVLRHTQPEFADISGKGDQMSNNALDAVVAAGWAGFVQLMDEFTIADLLAGRVSPYPHSMESSDTYVLTSHG